MHKTTDSNGKAPSAPKVPDSARANTMTHVSQDGRKCPTHDQNRVPIDYDAPKKGKKHSHKDSLGKDISWCKTCGRWGSHLTTNHDDWFAKLKERRMKQKEKHANKNSELTSTEALPSTSNISSNTLPTVSRGGHASYASVVHYAGSIDPF